MTTSSTLDKKTLLSLQELLKSRWLGSADSRWLEAEYKRYQEDPSQVSSEWRQLFDRVESNNSWSSVEHEEPNIPRGQHTVAVDSTSIPQEASQAISANSLINSFRTYGHLKAQLDPLGLTPTSEVVELTLQSNDLDNVDLSTELDLKGNLGLHKASLAKVIEFLQNTYCGMIGFEYQYICSREERHWLQEKIEKYNAIDSVQTKTRILHRLLESDGLEKHLGSQFVGQKRFSIEGADSLMPMLDTLAIAAAEKGVTAINMGMAHRGRLNVLINFLGKAPRDLFEEFLGKYNEEDVLSGDVKYHKGFSSELNTMRGKITAELSFNPSHLEIVNPVVEGINRAKQDQIPNEEEAHRTVLPILIHGDAAFAGQGVVMETLQLSQTHAYHTGGTIHVVLNNQVGFTTGPQCARSTRYCTDLGKMVEAPIFHVNGNDPESACRAIDLAFAFRNTFHKDVIIDLVCYRRHGHNEGDEPAATQPIMYQVIRSQGPVWQHYAKRLEKEGIIKAGEAEAWLSDYRKRVAKGDPVASMAGKTLMQDPITMDKQDWREKVNTGVAADTLKSFEKHLTALPKDMQLQPQVARVMTDRQKMLKGELALNWGTAETLAYASLLTDGFRVRLTGQDAERGTFAHRHAVLHDHKTGIKHTPLNHFSKNRQQFSIYDSILSEMATMGFEYGYATTDKQALVIWEAQYGDFVNGAQMVIDQFLSSSEQKWGKLNGLVLFLPHGYEGAGPEHSSARLERFLQLCAQNNIQVCAPTTPSQHFHLLRRQMLRQHWRKPLVIMTPKSLLRHKKATATLEELNEGAFQPVLRSEELLNTSDVKRMVLCSGKVYYDLMAAKSEKYKDVAIIRVEQLYPFPDEELRQVIHAYTHVNELVWCQEEPKNQGAWQWISSLLQELLAPNCQLSYVGRLEAAATAVGSPLRHAAEQKQLIQKALGE